jgi:hypothetical protein
VREKKKKNSTHKFRALHFRQGVRDEKMLEKLATHDVDDVTTLLALADKCARAVEGRAWHSVPQVKVTKMCDSDVIT